MLFEIFDIERDGVHEKDESKAEGSNSAKDGRFDGDVYDSESVRTYDGTEGEEYGDLRESRALDEAREQRRDDDDDADKSEGCGEKLWAKCGQTILLRNAGINLTDC